MSAAISKCFYNNNNKQLVTRHMSTNEWSNRSSNFKMNYHDVVLNNLYISTASDWDRIT